MLLCLGSACVKTNNQDSTKRQYGIHTMVVILDLRKYSQLLPGNATAIQLSNHILTLTRSEAGGRPGTDDRRQRPEAHWFFTEVIVSWRSPRGMKAN
ncbi:MAG: hypothetical protein JWM16_2932 [Verrucomicrobiales bacterium]|nr:hypothetical protein [Verrucomicrobiales bacterium]